MSTFATAPVEYKVVSFDADSTASELSDGLSKLGRESWTVVSSYHLHHLNAIHYVLVRQLASSTK